MISIVTISLIICISLYFRVLLYLYPTANVFPAFGLNETQLMPVISSCLKYLGLAVHLLVDLY